MNVNVISSIVFNVPWQSGSLETEIFPLSTVVGSRKTICRNCGSCTVIVILKLVPVSSFNRQVTSSERYRHTYKVHIFKNKWTRLHCLNRYITSDERHWTLHSMFRWYKTYSNKCVQTSHLKLLLDCIDNNLYLVSTFFRPNRSLFCCWNFAFLVHEDI